MNTEKAEKATAYFAKFVSLDCPFCHKANSMRVPEIELDVLTSLREPKPISILECSNCGHIAFFNRAIPDDVLDK